MVGKTAVAEKLESIGKSELVLNLEKIKKTGKKRVVKLLGIWEGVKISDEAIEKAKRSVFRY